MRWASLGMQAAQQRLAQSVSPLVIYVHGFDNHHAKIFRRLRRLEINFGVESLGFAWPSWGPYPKQQKRAEASLDAFAEMLADVAAVTLGAPHVTLVTHSMGNHLLQRHVEATGASNGLGFVDRVVLFAPDVAGRGHHDWTRELRPKREVWTVYNDHDSVLTWAEGLGGAHGNQRRLGRGGHAGDDGAIQYVDCTNAQGLVTAHSYFQGPAFNGNPQLRKTLRGLLRGESSDAIRGRLVAAGSVWKQP